MNATLPTILLVDDDAATRYSLRRYLKKLAVRSQIVEAEDGQQALAIVQAHCQHNHEPGSLLVLLDLNMPVMDGLAFLEQQIRLPDSYRQVMVVIVVSSTPSQDEREQARQLAVDIKPKPLTIEQLAELVRQYLPNALP